MDRSLEKVQLACFALGDKLFAVDIMRIKEIILPQKLSPLPTTSDLLDGVINLRGNVIPVMNMRKRFMMPAAPADKPYKLLVVTLAQLILALMVDDVMEVVTVRAEDIKPPIQMVTGVGMEFLLGVSLTDGRVIMILDIDSLLRSQDMAEICNAGTTQ
jgi:purine-binding chemotaxis protein CheW